MKQLSPLSYRIFQFAEKEQLFSQGDKVVVSFSGGADSLFLLRWLQEVRGRLDLQIKVVHFDHNLRPESKAEAQEAKEMAIGEEFIVHKAPPFASQVNLHQAAREWRRGLLIQEMQENGFQKIALGHHLDDLVETQVFRLLRGSSFFSLNPMLPIDGPLVRPLLREQKNTLQQALTAQGENWIEDPSNQNQKYSRSQIRSQVIPLLEKSCAGSLQEKFLYLAEDAAELNELFDLQIPKETYEVETLPYQSLQNQAALFSREIVHRYLLYHGVKEVHRSQIQEIVQLIQSGRGGWKIDIKGLQVRGSKSIVTIH